MLVDLVEQVVTTSCLTVYNFLIYLNLINSMKNKIHKINRRTTSLFHVQLVLY